jgi:hypothetical protein
LTPVKKTAWAARDESPKKDLFFDPYQTACRRPRIDSEAVKKLQQERKDHHAQDT